MERRYLIAIAGFIAIIRPAATVAGSVPRALDAQSQQASDASSTAAKDDIVVASHDDSYDNDSHEEKFSYTYKNIGSKTIKVAVTVKAQHHGFYEGKTNPPAFRKETFPFTLAPGEEHEVSGTWKIEKPADEGDPDMQYGGDDNPDLLQATYSDSK